MISRRRLHATFWGVRQEKKTIRAAAYVFFVCEGSSSRSCNPWTTGAARTPTEVAGRVREKSIVGRHLAPRKLAARREACFQGEGTVNRTEECPVASTKAVPGLRCFQEKIWK